MSDLLDVGEHHLRSERVIKVSAASQQIFYNDIFGGRRHRLVLRSDQQVIEHEPVQSDRIPDSLLPKPPPKRFGYGEIAEKTLEVLTELIRYSLVT